MKFKDEELYLENTFKTIELLLNKLDKSNLHIKKNIKELQLYLMEHVYKLIDFKAEEKDVVKLMNTNYANYEINLEQIKNLKLSLKKPYFGNITFLDEKNNENKVYIGVKDIVDEKNHSIVSDWRASISSLYYNHDLGPANYITDKSQYDVNLIGKRQIGIKGNKLEYVYDTDAKINDELLIHCLMNQKSSSLMKNIIQTIQSKQNEIIRKPRFLNLLINGIAGSGKTSIAMHRLAYLLYSDKEHIKTENIIIISPNQLFSNYISNLLPELGEENVDSYSFRTLVSEHFPELITTETKSEMLENAFKNEDKKRLKDIQEKYSSLYAEKLMNFLASINIEKLVNKVYYNEHTIHLENLEKKYSLTYENRYKIFRKIDFILDEIILKHFKRANEKKQEEIKNDLREQIVEKIISRKLFDKFIEKNNIPTNSKNGKIAHEDIPAYAFVLLSILGFRPKEKYKVVFIDEIQDYDALSLKIIREIFPSATFIIVGDIKQNLISTNDNTEFIKSILPNCITYNLDTSYRSTIEIMTFANSIIDYHYDGQFLRHGEKPSLYQTNKYIECIKDIANKNKDKQIAIICKSKKEAEEMKKTLPDWSLIDTEYTKEGELDNKNIITTVYLSKGLEFDVVIIPNVCKEQYNTCEDKQILYIMATRALHNLYLLTKNNNSPFLNDKNAKKYINMIKL